MMQFTALSRVFLVAYILSCYVHSHLHSAGHERKCSGCFVRAEIWLVLRPD